MFVKETQPYTNPEGPTAQASNPIIGNPNPKNTFKTPKPQKLSKNENKLKKSPWKKYSLVFQVRRLSFGLGDEYFTTGVCVDGILGILI